MVGIAQIIMIQHGEVVRIIILASYGESIAEGQRRKRTFNNPRVVRSDPLGSSPILMLILGIAIFDELQPHRSSACNDQRLLCGLKGQPLHTPIQQFGSI